MFEDIFTYYQHEAQDYAERFDDEFDERWERWKRRNPNSTEEEEARAFDRIYYETVKYLNN